MTMYLSMCSLDRSIGMALVFYNAGGCRRVETSLIATTEPPAVDLVQKIAGEAGGDDDGEEQRHGPREQRHGHCSSEGERSSR